ncbi:hypothetical protein PPERSA_04759 [Pseudocohnilembus persalinus]|uniref:Uncharacterized protein n=1 Tax=Pseudocohnilembus persalinus TaxID=266149 RepID=A0A0V0QNE9_PSEPJ|nr:hypothetical protein PPERSA_04759 [Pseudocohnilembus persalinus]|eukprot:KRX03881.1 hypothetical protein PPERSA_04759 [Pseudocohnilembus persalinus]
MRYYKFGQILDQRVVLSLGKDFFICILTWPLLYIWSYNALILQKLIINGLNSKIAVLYQHLTQALMFMLVMFFIIEQQWSLTNTAYATIHTCVHFMKMHSYTQMNKYYREEWKQDQNQGQQTSSYPNNISFKNFTLYMWMPVLAYQIEYPRTDKFRIGFFLFKVFQVIICISLDYIIGIEFVIPYIELGDQIGGLQLMCYIVLPMTLFSMISFVLIFEATMNAFAEITYFGDRQFYQDWWNSTTYEEFNRKWNRTCLFGTYTQAQIQQNCCINYNFHILSSFA